MSETKKEFDNLPKHIAIIPDGNRRWAKEKGKISFEGHYEGEKRSREILDEGLRLKAQGITFWGCSVSNLENRRKIELDVLYKIFKKSFSDLIKSKSIVENKVRIRVLGRWREFFPKDLTRVVEDAIEKTKNFSNLNLTFLLAYDGRDEMVEAINKITNNKHQITNEEFKHDLVKKHLWTHDLPPVDLVIRTGGEPHWSAGFMMWDTAESQFYFTEKYWPDFGVQEFHKALNSYAQRERRLGK